MTLYGLHGDTEVYRMKLPPQVLKRLGRRHKYGVAPKEQRYIWTLRMAKLAGSFVVVKTVAGLNAREHWAKKAKRVYRERLIGRLIGRTRKQPLPVRVTFTRYSVQSMDSDNLPQCFKAIRDGIADALGCGDAPSAPVEWVYQQEKCPRGCWGIRCLIESVTVSEVSAK